MDQTVINWALGVLGTLFGFLLNKLWESVRDLQKADEKIAEKVGNIEVLVAGAYIRKDEFHRVNRELKDEIVRLNEDVSAKLDKIADRLSSQ